MEENLWTSDEKITASRLIRYEWKKRKVFYIVMLVLFLVWISAVIKTNYYDSAQLKKYGKYTVAEIIEYHTAGKSQPYTTYRYVVADEIYEASLAKHLSICSGKFRCVGAKFKLEYSCKNPDIHRLLLEQRWNDSLALGTILE